MDVASAELLKSCGLRVTRQRLALVDALHDAPHSDTATVLTMVREELPSVSHQAVYDGLAALTEAGAVRRIQPAGSVARYELRVGDNHHHLVCRQCGAIEDVDCAVGTTPCLTAADERSYAIDEAEVNYWGLCPSCLRNTPRTTDTIHPHENTL